MPRPDFLTELRKANRERQREWDPEYRLSGDYMFFAVELGGEVGELLNKIKKLRRECLSLPGSRASLSEIAEEMADVLIVLDLLAISLGVRDLAVRTARKFNKRSRELNFKTLISNVPETESE